MFWIALEITIREMVNPDDRTVEIRRSNQTPIVLQDGELLTVPDVLPGWEVPIADFWSPVFE